MVYLPIGSMYDIFTIHGSYRLHSYCVKIVDMIMIRLFLKIFRTDLRIHLSN